MKKSSVKIISRYERDAGEVLAPSSWSLSSSSISSENAWAFPRVWSAFLLLLVGVTFRLWLPNDYPPVPMADWVGAIPDSVTLLPQVTFFIGGLLVLVNPERFRVAWWLIAGGLLFSFIADQHRLQPWAYQTAIYATVFATCDPATARRTLIPLAASVYIYSAAGKLDYQFVHSVGQDFLRVPLQPFGLFDALAAETRAKVALLFPITELVAGVLLLFPKSHRAGGWMVIAIHLSLFVLLSPLGLNHSLGVLVWNLALIAQAWFLFIKPSPADRDEEQKVGNRFTRTIARVVVLVALLAPATERMEIWDHWTSWALYSPHNSRVDVEIHRTDSNQLPSSAQACLDDDPDDDGWHHLALDEWSLMNLAVPVYPQARYQLGLANILAEESKLSPSAIRCRIRSVSNRLTGARTETPLIGRKEIKEALEDYWFVAKTSAK